MRRFVGVATIAVGLFLIAVPFATDLFDRTRGAERTFEAMHDFVSEPGIELARRNFGTVAPAGRELNGELIPGLARRLDVTPEQFKTQIAREYPDIATASERIPGYLMFVGPTIDALDENREEFEAGESLPGAALPITSAPWLFLILGGLVTGAGVLVLRCRARAPRRGGRPRRRRHRPAARAEHPVEGVRRAHRRRHRARRALPAGRRHRGGDRDGARQDGPAGPWRDGARHRARARRDAVGRPGRARARLPRRLAAAGAVGGDRSRRDGREARGHAAGGRRRLRSGRRDAGARVAVAGDRPRRAPSVAVRRRVPGSRAGELRPHAAAWA